VVWVLSSVDSSESPDFEENPWTSIEPHQNLLEKEQEGEPEDGDEDWELQLALKNSEVEASGGDNNEKGSSSHKQRSKEKESGGKEVKPKPPLSTAADNSHNNKDNKDNKDNSHNKDNNKKKENKPILLCHWHERHYGSLASVTSRELKEEAERKSRVPPQTVNPRYEDYNHWTEY